MESARPSVIGRHLGWAFIQAALFLPGVLAAFGRREVSGSPRYLVALSVLLVLWLGFCLVRNLALMWRAPIEETRRSHVAALLGAGLVLIVLAGGPLLEGTSRAKPTGAVILVIALALVALGVREVARLRSVGRVGLEPTTQGL